MEKSLKTHTGNSEIVILFRKNPKQTKKYIKKWYKNVFVYLKWT